MGLLIDIIRLSMNHMNNALTKAINVCSQNPWPQDCLLLNIWNARLFPAMDDARSSVKHACQLIESLNSNKPISDKNLNTKLYSMVDILKEKDIDGIFYMRAEIRKAILP